MTHRPKKETLFQNLDRCDRIALPEGAIADAAKRLCWPAVCSNKGIVWIIDT
jgi:hypothetical protein